MDEKKLFILVLLCLCLIVILPDAIKILAAGENYYPYHYFGTNFRTIDFTMYSALINHVDILIPKEAQIFEAKDNTLQREWVPFFAAGFLSEIFQENWGIVIKVIGGAAAFVASFLLFGRWVRDGTQRIAVSGFFVLFPAIIGIISLNPFELVQRVSRLLFEYHLFIDRFQAPIVTFPILLLAIYFTLKSFDQKSSKSLILAGVFAGLLFYTYFYYVLFFAGLLFVLCCEFFILHKKSNSIAGSFPKKSIFIFAVAVLVALPFFLFSLANILSGVGSEMALRAGLQEITRPYYILVTLKYLIISLIALFALKFNFSAMQENEIFEKVFFTGIILGGVFAMNMHLFTGFNIQFLHWQDQVVDPAAFLLIASLIAQWKRKQNNPDNPLVGLFDLLEKKSVVIILVVLLFGIFVQLREAGKSCSQEGLIVNGCEPYSIDFSEKEAIVWFEKNSLKDDVVLTLSAQTSSRISADTGRFVYIPNGFITTVKNSEIELRLAEAYKFFRVPGEKFEWLLTPDKKTIQIDFINSKISAKDRVLFEKALIVNYPFHFLYYTTKVWHKNKFEEAISEWDSKTKTMLNEDVQEGITFFYPKSVVDRLVAIHQNALGLSRRVDWVWVGEYEKSIGNVEEFENDEQLVKRFENEKVTIYEYLGQNN